jgi:hypothetical protein
MDFTTRLPLLPRADLHPYYFLLRPIFPICYQIIHIFAMVAFMHLALLLPLFLAPIVPGTFVAKRDLLDIYKHYILMSQTLMGPDHRTTMHHHGRPRWEVQDLSTRTDRKLHRIGLFQYHSAFLIRYPHPPQFIVYIFIPSLRPGFPFY